MATLISSGTQLARSLDHFDSKRDLAFEPEETPRRPQHRFSPASVLLILTIARVAVVAKGSDSSSGTFLTDGWAIQSSTKIRATGGTISTMAFKPVDWYPATV